MTEILVSVVMMGMMAGGSIYLRYRIKKQREDWRSRKRLLPSPYRTEQHDLDDRIIVAHESGHAVTAWFSRYVHSIECINVDRGFVAFMHMNAQSPKGLYAQMSIALGGLAGEMISIGRIRSVHNSCSDLDKALKRARALIARQNEKSVSSLLSKYPEESFLLDISRMYDDALPKDVVKLLNSAYVDAHAIIQNDRTAFDRLQLSLLQFRRLDAEAITKILGPRSWPERKNDH